AAAREALVKAQAVLEAADAECLQLAKDFEVLQQLEAAAPAMVAELAATQGADPARASELSQQLLKCSQDSMAQASAVAGTAAMRQPRRMAGKQEPAVISAAASARLDGKRPKETTLQGFWPDASRKVLKSAVGEKLFGLPCQGAEEAARSSQMPSTAVASVVVHGAVSHEGGMRHR
ncbi:unnamed protein product, partial [Prorocentrum cordatum]